MSRWYVERRTAAGTPNVSSDVARHLMTRYTAGSASIVVATPLGFLSPLRKSWLRLVRHVLRERARTCDPGKIRDFSEIVVGAQRVPFTATNPDQPDGVVILAASDCARRRGDATLYLTCVVDRDELGAILAGLPDGALIVDYTGQAVEAIKAA